MRSVGRLLRNPLVPFGMREEDTFVILDDFLAGAAAGCSTEVAKVSHS